MKLLTQNKPNVFLFMITFGLLFHVFIRGYNPQDEAWVLYGAWRIFEGEIPYLDFQYLYTPLTAFLGAFSFLIFDVSIFSQRLLALIIASSTSAVLYSLLRLFKLSQITSLVFVLLFIIWGPLHTNYLSPAIISIEIGIVYLFLLIRGFQKSESTLFLFFAGNLGAIIILTKQTFGTAIIIHAFLLGIYFFQNQKKKQLISFYSGIIVPGLIFLIYLFTTNSLNAFISEMYSFLILDAAAGGFSYQTPFTFPAPFLYKAAKIALYSFPLVISLLSLLLEIRQKSSLFFIPLLGGLFYIVGIQPVLDTIHLSPLIALSSLSMGLLFARSRFKKARLGIFLFTFILVIVGLFNGIFRNYFKWFSPIYTNNSPLTSPYGKILINPNDAKIINETTLHVTQNTTEKDYFFNYGMTPLFYFLSQRVSPSKFNTIETRNVTGSNLNILMNDLRNNKPKLIISDGTFAGINPKIEQFIISSYEQTATISGRPVFKIR